MKQEISKIKDHLNPYVKKLKKSNALHFLKFKFKKRLQKDELYPYFRASLFALVAVLAILLVAGIVLK